MSHKKAMKTTGSLIQPSKKGSDWSVLFIQLKGKIHFSVKHLQADAITYN